ncbi:leptin receptor [Lates japonicus]|uniref:Leptin receptor n=1 Tax=Lates japonicus TaxID=270547 RepID=A0AAD3M9J2_LATJO|nr:leptin receptor [Lates japonicus]
MAIISGGISGGVVNASQWAGRCCLCQSLSLLSLLSSPQSCFFTPGGSSELYVKETAAACECERESGFREEIQIKSPGHETGTNLQERLRFTPAKAQQGHAHTMTTTMVWSVMLTVLIHIFLVSHGAQCLEPEVGASLRAGALDLPWQDELCCDSPSAHLDIEGGGMHAQETNRSESDLPHHPLCSFRSSTTESNPREPTGGTCLDILCRIDENWEKINL